ncbi:unnamed protein product, partial [marine sediment metagenome]
VDYGYSTTVAKLDCGRMDGAYYCGSAADI